MKRYLFLSACLVLGISFGIGASIYRNRRAEKLGFMARSDAETFVRAHSPSIGAADAKVIIVEFTDPACETCAALSEHLLGFVKAHPGQVRLVVRYAPFHEGSSEAVRILEGARRQGLFWETLHALFDNQEGWVHHHRVQPERIWEFLGATGVDAVRLRKDLGDPEIAGIIQQDLLDAQKLGVQKTPGIFVNGRPLEPFGLQTLHRLVALEIGLNYGS